MTIQETRMKIQEASEDLHMGGIMFPKYRGKLFEGEDLKSTENQRLRLEERQNVPRAFEKCLGHDLVSHAPREFHMCLGHAFFLSLMRLGCLSCTPCMQKVGVQLSFPSSVLGKARTFSPNSGRNSQYKYQPSSFRISRSELWQFKRKATLVI